ncbi:MAG: CPBP family intramembrane metalloprotease [Planctomycetales bacterium]|nr:CPBP family intramembrane metalloprotease [Planctomycetales bacterium]
MPRSANSPNVKTSSVGGYWRQSRRPLTSLVFVLPLLLVYEGGVLALGPSAVRNGADVWLRHLLNLSGFGEYFLLPLLTVAALLAWHHLTHEPWKISLPVLYVMLLESICFGLLLLVIAQFQARALAMAGSGSPSFAVLSLGEVIGNWLGRLVTYFGAGIYEEVMFRLLLLPLLYGAAKVAGVAQKRDRAVIAVLLSSLAFSAAHYLGPAGEAFDLFSFCFRFSAGAFFAVVFVLRGFGIAAGAHAAYDIFVGLF